MQIRHGDILLTRVGPTESGTRRMTRITLARGELTGHAHVLRGRGIRRDGEDILAPEGGALTHDEHATLVLVPGRYHLTHQREYGLDLIAREVRD